MTGSTLVAEIWWAKQKVNFGFHRKSRNAQGRGNDFSVKSFERVTLGMKLVPNVATTRHGSGAKCGPLVDSGRRSVPILSVPILKVKLPLLKDSSPARWGRVESLEVHDNNTVLFGSEQRFLRTV